MTKLLNLQVLLEPEAYSIHKLSLKLKRRKVGSTMADCVLPRAFWFKQRSNTRGGSHKKTLGSFSRNRLHSLEDLLL